MKTKWKNLVYYRLKTKTKWKNLVYYRLKTWKRNEKLSILQT